MNKTERGRWGESLAAKYLEKQRLRIIEKNWRQGRNEIDIIARDDATWVFVEVKVRKFGFEQEALESVDLEKQLRIIHAADRYLASRKGGINDVRFDIICVYYEKGQHKIQHLEDAFICLP